MMEENLFPDNLKVSRPRHNLPGDIPACSTFTKKVCINMKE